MMGAPTVDQLNDVRRRWLAGEVHSEIAYGTGLKKEAVIRIIRVHFGPAESAVHARAVARKRSAKHSDGPKSVVFEVSALDKKSVADRIARHGKVSA